MNYCCSTCGKLCKAKELTEFPVEEENVSLYLCKVCAKKHKETHKYDKRKTDDSDE